jgi:hypothetical protein
LNQIEISLARLSDDDYWKLFHEVFKLNTSHNIRATSALLAQHGWFIDSAMPPNSAVSLAEMIQSGREEEAYAELEAYYTERRKSIEAELTTRFPHRSRFLANCFRSHDAGDYNTSVPLCLIQADGICHDLFGDQLFRIRNGTLRVRKKVDAKKLNWLCDAFVEPLRGLLPLAIHDSPGVDKFNRHLILHGTDLEYGTRRNSLRAISLLSYLQGTVEIEEETKRIDGSSKAKGSICGEGL